MKKRHLALMITVLAALSAGLSRMAEADENEKVIEGVLIDTKCYAQDSRNWVNDHETPNGTMANCGAGCAAMGIPVGILEGGKEGGAVYVLLVPSRSLADHVGKWGRVTGRVVFDGSLLVKSLEVKGEDGQYKKVSIVSMM